MKYKPGRWLLTTILGLFLWGTCATNVRTQPNTFPPTGNAGIGTTTPDARLVVTSNTGTLPSSTGIARFAEADGVQTSVFLDGFNANGGFLVRRANTSAASPSAVLSGDLLGFFGAAGYGTSAYSATRARIAFGAAENWTNTANGTFITFSTTANGSATAGGTERLRINSAGNIGFGTSDIEAWPNNHSVIESVSSSILFSPDTGLHLNSNSYYDAVAKYKASGFGAANYQLYNGAHYWRVAPSGSADAGIPWLNSMTLNSAGNVGIGTWSPGSAKLHITSGASGATPYTSGGNPELMLESPTATDLHLLSPNTGSGRIWFASPSSNLAGGLTYTHSATLSSGVMRFLTGGNATRMTILGGGNVGIGTETPAYKLDVAGVVHSSTGGFRFPDGTVQTTAAAGGETSQWTTSGSSIYYNSGSVGIGTTTPAARLEVKSAASTHNSLILNTTSANFADSLVFQEAGSAKASIQHNPSVSAGALLFNTNGIASPTNTRMVITGAGGVGIGTTTPAARLDVRQNSGTLATLLTSYGANEDTYIRGGASSAVVHIGDVTSTTSKVLLMENGGTVGIGTASPNTAYKLDVNGHTNVTGNINVTGTINAKYQDVAEWVPSTHALPAGTVVTLDPTKSNHVEASSKAYDTRVAGVVSAQPGIALGEEGQGKVLVATTGRVRIKVDASHGPIEVGDLLVSSNVPGVAMKSKPIDVGGVEIHRPGTLIGKALEPLAKGQGEILVLLSLQ